LEDADWKQANEYFDKVLDIDPEYAPAYIGKLCAELRVRQEEQLAQNEKPLTEYGHFQKVLRFADADCRMKLEQYNKAIQDRIAEEKRQEKERKQRELERIYKGIEPLRSYKTLIATKKEEAEKKDAELRRKYEEDMKRWQEDVSRKQKQSNEWKSRKLCPHCGGKISFFNGKCKTCEKEPSMPVDMPVRPTEPEYNEQKLNTSNILQSIHVSFGGIDWMVLDIYYGRALLFTENNVAKKPYNEAKEFLRGDFMKKFSEVEKDMINNKEVFLLSGSEVLKYFGNSRGFRHGTSGIALDFYPQNNKLAEAGDFWLRELPDEVDRDSYEYKAHKSYVAYVGTWEGHPPYISGLSSPENTQNFGVRPALWLKLE